MELLALASLQFRCEQLSSRLPSLLGAPTKRVLSGEVVPACCMKRAWCLERVVFSDDERRKTLGEQTCCVWKP